MSPVSLIAAVAAAAFFARAPDDAPRALPGRVGALMARMTLEEKIGQLVQLVDQVATGPGGGRADDKLEARLSAGGVGSILNALGAGRTNALQRLAVDRSRLKIPVLFGYDVIHGYATIFPVPLAQAASWNPGLIERAEAVAAAEAAATGIRWTFAPMVDIARDPRWGRVMEGAGEDPFLGAAIAAARVRGFQGSGSGIDTVAPEHILACAKHFVGYGAAEGGRDYETVELSERTLREVYFPPFRAAVAAGVATLMTSFNEVSGVPSTGNRFLFTDVLRGEWGFGGFVVSDWGAIDELRAHGLAADRADAARQAITAGVDMDMVSDVYAEQLAGLVRAKAVPMAAIDQAVRRILTMKMRAGLFDHPLTDEARAAGTLLAAPHRALAAEVARQSIVLLKNDRDLLPLSRSVRTLAVIGPHADNHQDPLGEWSAQGDASQVVSLLDGIRQEVSPSTRVVTAAGTDVDGKDAKGIAAAVALARQADVVVLAVGESRQLSGEAHSRAALDLPGTQKDLVQAIAGTGKPVVLVLANGRPLTVAREAAQVTAVLETWLLGTQSGQAIADVLFGDFNPSGKLPITFPRTIGQVPLYYNHKNTGRPHVPGVRYTSGYLDVPNAPAWPFGFGLSYTRFAYSGLTVTPARLPVGGEVAVTARVTNTGARPGAEVVQLYVRDRVGSTTRPVKELRGFHRVTLGPGASEVVSFTLHRADLSVLDGRYRPVQEPGAFDVWVGPDSAHGLEGSFTWLPHQNDRAKLGSR
jgi:beta-glucosidase